jgi:hypothetical protein
MSSYPFNFFPDPIRILSLLALTLTLAISILGLTRASFSTSTPTRIRMSSLSSITATLASFFHILMVCRRFSLQEDLIIHLSPPAEDHGFLFLVFLTFAATWISLTSLLIQVLYTVRGAFNIPSFHLVFENKKAALLSVLVSGSIIVGVYGTISSVMFLYTQLWYMF